MSEQIDEKTKEKGVVYNWRDVKKWLQSEDKDKGLINPACPLCKTSLDIYGVVEQGNSPNPVPPACAMCRFPLNYKYCFHEINPHPLPSRTDEDNLRDWRCVPPVAREPLSGGSLNDAVPVPSRCSLCDWETAVEGIATYLWSAGEGAQLRDGEVYDFDKHERAFASTQHIGSPMKEEEQMTPEEREETNQLVGAVKVMLKLAAKRIPIVSLKARYEQGARHTWGSYILVTFMDMPRNAERRSMQQGDYFPFGLGNIWAAPGTPSELGDWNLEALTDVHVRQIMRWWAKRHLEEEKEMKDKIFAQIEEMRPQPSPEERQRQINLETQRLIEEEERGAFMELGNAGAEMRWPLTGVAALLYAYFAHGTEGGVALLHNLFPALGQQNDQPAALAADAAEEAEEAAVGAGNHGADLPVDCWHREANGRWIMTLDNAVRVTLREWDPRRRPWYENDAEVMRARDESLAQLRDELYNLTLDDPYREDLVARFTFQQDNLPPVGEPVGVPQDMDQLYRPDFLDEF